MIQSATGIILRTRPLTETSLIVQWLTPEFGRISTVAKGARRPKSPFGGKLDLFYLADFSFTRSRRSELHTLREVSLRETHAAFRRDLGLLQQAAYCARLVEQTTETDTPLPHVYELMCGFLDHLPKQPPQPRNVYAFELKLLNELGLKPDVPDSRLSPGTKTIIQALTHNDWLEVAQLTCTAAQAMELRRFLHGFLIYHVERLPAGRSSALNE